MMRIDQRLVAFTATLSTLALAACSGETGVPESAPENSFAPPNEYSEGDIDHLLLRTEFGIEPEHRARAEAIGFAAYVDEMLAFPTTGTTAAEAEAANLLVNGSDPAGLEGKFPSDADISEWWIYLMLNSEHPFQERLALFWHDHFAISYSAFGGSERYMVVDYIERLRDGGTGNFKSLVLELSRDSAMLEWLNGAENRNVAPNENFAREFFELFTVGAYRGYTEDDVKEAARAFSGYRSRFDGNTALRYHELDFSRKDTDDKVLFGDVVLESNGLNGDDFGLVVDATFAHLDVASWLAEKLILEFITNTPNSAMTANFAAVIREHNFEMQPILRTMLLSQAFQRSQGDMIRMPVDFGVGIARSTGLIVSPSQMRQELTSSEQLPGDPPSVFGWPQGENWLSAASMVERANLVRRLIGDRSQSTTDALTARMPAGSPSPAEVVDHFALLMDVQVSTDERTALIEYLNTHVRNDNSLEEDPFDPTDSQDISNRVRGLLYILANHPTAHRS